MPVVPNLWAVADDVFRIPCTTHAQHHARGSQNTRPVVHRYLPLRRGNDAQGKSMYGHPLCLTHRNTSVPWVSTALWRMGVGKARGENQTTNAKIPEHSHQSQHATEIGEPGRMVGSDFCNEATDWEIKSMTSTSVVASSDFELLFCAIGVFSSLACANTLARACANYSFITLRTSSVIRASSEGEMVVS